MNASYTSLESLLVFESLLVPVTSSTFSRISDQLQAIPLIRDDPTYEAARLSPDALRDLYLRLLKDEVKLDRDQQNEKEKHATNGDVSPSSRKRKAPSPSLPTVNEAAQHSHLIPHLVARLYARYREESISTIREHERRYDALTHDAADIQAGKWDEQLQQQRKAAVGSPGLSTVSLPKSEPARQEDDHAKIPAVQALPAGSAPPTRLSQVKIGAVDNYAANSHDGPNGNRRASSQTPTAPLPAAAPHSPRIGALPKLQSGTSNSAPNSRLQSPYPTHPGNAGTVVIPRSSSSPRPSLPPNSNSTPQPSAPTTGSSNLRGAPLIPHQQYPPPSSPQATNYQQQPYQDRRTTYPLQQGQPIVPYPPQAPHSGVYQGQQPWVAGQPPGPQLMQQQQYTPRPLQAAAFPQITPGNMQFPATAPRPQPVSRMVSDIVAALATPPRQNRRTLWKTDGRRTPLTIANMPPRPDVEPLSPTLKRARSPIRPARSGRRVESPVVSEPGEVDLPTRKGRRRAVRDRRSHSVASSTAGKARSQSASTTAGGHVASDDRPISRGHIKAEPSTPAGMVEYTESLRERSATPASGMVTRKRRGTAQRQSRRRQSSAAPAGEDVGMAYTPPPLSKTVTATRNFAKMSVTLIDDINGHKHAAHYRLPVTETVAAGYSDIIKQPQYMKAIRAAITAGTKAKALAAAAVDADVDTTLELERTADLIPPKAIVNGVQLEKEVMRIFANAVMFNPGEDGMVSDTREMFEAVERMIAVWRGAEREAVGDDEEETKGKRRKL